MITFLRVAAFTAGAVFAAELAAAQGSLHPAGLVSLWAAEGNASDSAGSNQGLLRGAVTFDTGQVGEAFAFDGSGGYVEVPDDPSLQLLQEATLIAWVYLDALPSQTGFNYIAGRSQVGNDFDLEAEPDNRLRFYPCAGVGGGGYPGSTTILQTGVWYHVSATYKANERMELFVNGVKEVSLEIRCTVAGNPSPFTIGSSPIWGRPWHGRIDQVRLFDRALSTTAIENLYASELGEWPGTALTIRVSQVELCWKTLAGLRYQLQHRSDLTANFWVPTFTNFFRGTGGVLCTNNAVLPGQPEQFYRLVITNEAVPF